MPEEFFCDGMTTQEHWLEKAKDLSPRVALWYSQMEEQRKRLLEIVAEIDAEILDDTPDERKIETIGTLLLHIAAVEWSWIFEDIDGRTMDFERWKYAFPLRPSVDLPQLKGKPKQFFLERLAEVRAEVYQRLRRLADHDLEKSVGTGDDKFSIEWIFFHILEHEAMHIGQISLLARLSKLAERR
ncbi:MAG: DinB family protein [Candidatus Hodarchaeales archaeon]